MAFDLNDPRFDGSEKLFAIVARTSLLGIVITRLSDDRLIAVNDAYLALFGYTREEVIGKTALELGVWLHPADRKRLLERVGQGQAGERNLEAWFRRKDGEIGLLLMSAHVVDVNGEAHLIGMLSDITARQRAEKALRESEQRYRAVIEGQTEVISRFLVDNTMIFVNEVYCRYFGKCAEEIIGQKWHPVAHPDDLEGIQRQLALLSPAHPTVLVENRVFDRNNAIRWMQFVNTAFFDDQGRIAEIQSVGRDITEQKLAELALQDAKNKLEVHVEERTQQLRLLASKVVLQGEEVRQGIARDLHDDLGQLLHLSRIKLDSLSKLLDPSQIKDRLGDLSDILQRASDRVRLMTTELVPPVLERLGLIPAFRWLAEQMERHYGMTVEVVTDRENVTIDRVRSIMLYRAVRELLINVHKHAQTLFAVIEMTHSKDHLTLTVSDQGIGMRNRDGVGDSEQGFGLMSVREQMALFGGTMTLTTAPDMGTSVSLALPVPHPLPSQEPLS